jgi:plastocyanin
LSVRATRVLTLAAVAAGAPLVFAISGSSGAERPKAGAAQAAQTLSIRLDDFDLGSKTRIPTGGQTTIKLWNAGRFPHNWTVVSGPTRVASQTLNRNGRQQLSANLRPGAYMVICTVGNGNHLAQGMYRQINVGVRNQQTGQWEDAPS